MSLTRATVVAIALLPLLSLATASAEMHLLPPISGGANVLGIGACFEVHNLDVALSTRCDGGGNCESGDAYQCLKDQFEDILP